MNQQNQENKKIPTTKGILAWVREILNLKAPELDSSPMLPSPETVTSLISRATGNTEEKDESLGNRSGKGNNAEEKNSDNENKDGDNGGKDKKESCPYALRRNIVESLREIRRFAEEHDLAATMIRSLLSLLADMALNAMKGKVSASVLDALLKIFSYDKIKDSLDSVMREKDETLRKAESDLEDAYRRGELAGRNARIREEIFPAEETDLPYLKGKATATQTSPDIFSIAKDA